MTNQWKWAGLIVAAAIGIAVLMVWLRPDPVQEEPEVSIPLVETVAFEATAGTIPVIVSGTVQPRDEVVIGPQVSGRLTYVNPAFREGQFVAAGTVLVRIDATDFENQVRIAKADVAAQDVAVLQAREEVEIAKADLAQFDAREKLAQGANEAGNTSRILPPKAIAEAMPQPSAPTASSQAAKRSGLATREPQLRSAQAARERAGASLADARTALSRTRISVPFSGLVRDENAAVGALVQVGQTLGTVASTSAYEVRLSLTEDEAAIIPGLLQRSGANTRADVIYEYGGLTYSWPAVIDRADASLDETTRNVEVFLRVPNPLRGGSLIEAKDGRNASASPAPPLLLGAFVTARIEGTSLDSYAAIPSRALRPGNTIWVVRDDKLRILDVRVIQRSDDIAYVTTASIDEGGLLVTNALPAPTDGMDVRVAGADA